MIRRTLLAITVTGLVGLTAVPALADGPTVTGAGSTWVAIALEQWRADATRFGLSINYQGVGSTSGRQFFIIGQTDFAATEIPFEPSEKAELDAAGIRYQYLPDVAGGTALMYNLKDAAGNRIYNLQLSAPTAAGIFTGKIKYWDDPAITHDNNGRKLQHQQIRPVIRSDGSGTSAKLADYFAYTAPSIFRPFMQQTGSTLPMSFWPNLPNSVGQKSSDGVANFIANDQTGAGSIGYVEAGYALYRRFPVAGLLNKAGNYALPSSTNVATALKHATLNPDLTQNLVGVYNAPEATAYPLASYSYLVTHTEVTSGFTEEDGAVLGKWILYIACAGQKSAAPLGYSPLPANLVRVVFDAVKNIPGAPAPPLMDQCANPTITGEGFGGGGYADFPNQTSVLPTAGNGGQPSDQPTAGTGDPSAGGGGGGNLTINPTTGLPTTSDATASGVSVTPLDDGSRQLRFQQGVEVVAAASAGVSPPLWLGPFGLASLLLIPLAARLRSHRPSLRALRRRGRHRARRRLVDDASTAGSEAERGPA